MSFSFQDRPSSLCSLWDSAEKILNISLPHQEGSFYITILRVRVALDLRWQGHQWSCCWIASAA